MKANDNCSPPMEVKEADMQHQFFQQLRQQLPAHPSLVDVVADLLHVSTDSAYRRIRGETPLVLEEAALLCRRFNLSLDQMFQLSPSSVVFENRPAQSPEADFVAVLKTMLHTLETLHAAREKQVFYLTHDLPLFHLFCFPELMAFRYFFWMKAIFQAPSFASEPFSFACLPAEVKESGAAILALYNRLPSVEIWNTECVNGMLQQLRYYTEAGFIGPDDGAQVRAALNALLRHVERQAALGCKFLPGEDPRSKKSNLQLFNNRVGPGVNTILVRHDDRQTLYLNYDGLNYLQTTDPAFCRRSDMQLQAIMRRSTLISSVSEKQRNMFFNVLYGKLQNEESKTRLTV